MDERNGGSPRSSNGAFLLIALCFMAVSLVCTLFFAAPDFTFVLIAAFCVTAAILYLRNYSTLAVGSVLVVVLTGISVGATAYVAAQAGTTIQANMNAMGIQLQKTFAEVYGSAMTSQMSELIDQAVDLVLRFWPSMYFMSAAITVVLSFAVCSYIAKWFAFDLKVTPLRELDFSPNILWVPVAGLLAYAGSFVFGAYGDLLVTIALNVGIVTKVILVVQATGVYTGLVSRIKGWGFVKVFGYFCCLWLEMMFWAMSVIGLLDFWRNFRRLPRESVLHDEHGDSEEANKEK